METLEKACKNVYHTFENLPMVYPEEYCIWFGKHNYKNNHSYRVLVDKTKGTRKQSWEKLLTNYFEFPELALSGNNKFETDVWNTFFSSGYRVIDTERKRLVTAYTPWYSFLFRPFIGGDLILVKSKKYNGGIFTRIKNLFTRHFYNTSEIDNHFGKIKIPELAMNPI